MYVPDYYDWRGYEDYVDEEPFEYEGGMFICQLPEDYQEEIRDAIKKYLVKEEHMEEDTEEFDEVVDNAMDGRLWDIEDYIDLDKIFEEE